MLIVFWDYDGTLVNTEPIYKDSLNAFFEEKKYELKPITDEYFFKNIAGRHPEEFLEKLTNDGYIKKNLHIEPMDIKKYYTKYFDELKKGEIKITKDIDKVIEKLSEDKNIIMCITSSSYAHDFNIKHSNIANSTLKNIFNLNKNVYLCGEIEGCRFKPQSDIFEFAFKDIVNKYNLHFKQNDNIFIIEDSIAGCKAGHAFKEKFADKANVVVIGYLSAAVLDNSSNLIQNGADITIKTAEELFEYIKSFKRNIQ